jgi:molecular chaperone IbpA
MTTLDFSPLYRSAIGFDHLPSLLDTISTNDRSTSTYPPYNIELIQDDEYRITMAVAGFIEEKNEEENNYLHRGIAERNFQRKFKLADHIKVTGANLENGLLHIELEREIQEALKPRQITINGNNKRFLKSA